MVLEDRTFLRLDSMTFQNAWHTGRSMMTRLKWPHITIPDPGHSPFTILG
jgi:hypothetical protein